MMAADGPVIDIDHVYKLYTTRAPGGVGTLLALRDITLDVADGEFVTLVGPSGCGKSTLLHMVAGLHPATAGAIRYKGREVTQVNTGIGYITQGDNLLPWRTLQGNVELAMEFKGLPPAERRERAREYIHLVGLDGFEEFYPHELSGGMPGTRRPSSWMSRSALWTPRPAPSCRTSCSSSGPGPSGRPCSSPTTWWRASPSPTGSW
ncbi:MAG: ATP-binding cassette domain-containing protein [Deltaproteobacteria bacterium]|nr:ATP-binding cassette domain-containing protein [Deltaproteobacteria bacterium]